MIEQGASIIDIGGESTRPGASMISVEEELSVVMPVIEGILKLGLRLSFQLTPVNQGGQTCHKFWL